MNLKKIFTRNLLFVLLPSLSIATVALISALLFKNPWLKIALISTSYVLFLLFHCFKNGAFEKAQYDFKHGHFNLWYNQYKKEMQFTQLILAGGMLSVFVFKILNNSLEVQRLHIYGMSGFATSASLIILISAVIFWKQNEEYGWNELKSNPEAINETLMLIICSTVAVVLITEIYILSKTLYVLIPFLIIAVMLLTIHREGILPLNKNDFKRLSWEMSFPSIFLMGSMSYQLKIKPGVDYWVVVVLIISTMFLFANVLYSVLLKRKKGKSRKISDMRKVA